VLVDGLLGLLAEVVEHAHGVTVGHLGETCRP
jgi:hypothetical protein